MKAFLYSSDNHWNQYRIPSARATWWDYGKNGIYFVTICAKDNFPFFGTIENGKMKLSKIGAVAQQYWLQIPQMTFGEVQLSSFVIMPNHIHGIIILDRTAEEEPVKVKPVKTIDKSSQPHPLSKTPHLRTAFFKQISPKKGSLPHLIRKFKGLVTKEVRAKEWLASDQPLWQARYYDRIVRDEDEHQRLSQHIHENPMSWSGDDYHCHEPAWQMLPEGLRSGLQLIPAVDGAAMEQHASECSMDKGQPDEQHLANDRPTPWWWWYWERHQAVEHADMTFFERKRDKIQSNASTNHLETGQQLEV